MIIGWKSSAKLYMIIGTHLTLSSSGLFALYRGNSLAKILLLC